MDLGFSGRVALVTGAARGIGRAIAARLAAEGARLILLDRADAAEMTATTAEVQAAGAESLAVQADVTVYAEVQRAVAEATARFGGIDILVNNAGIVSRKAILEVGPEEWDRVLSTNLTGCFHCSQIVGRQMVARGNGGRIVNISSIHGRVAKAAMGSYCASKAGIDMFTKQLAVELAPQHIAVNAVACGTIRSDINIPLYKSTEPEDIALQTRTRRRIPLDSFGEPEDIADAVAYLSSATAARYVTGVILYVDGGYVADGTPR
jgi:NAD(P)-dependent dehydrogenase (short-subunit alcohol dehydrogenase family)